MKLCGAIRYHANFSSDGDGGGGDGVGGGGSGGDGGGGSGRVLHHARFLPAWHSKNVSFSEAGSMMYKRGEYCSGGIIKGR